MTEPLVVGIGGFFFRARDPEALSLWYREHLDIDPVPDSYEGRTWHQAAGPTVFAPFPAATDYFGNAEQAWMINLRVRDLDALRCRLKSSGITVLAEQTLPNGRFARIHDPEGNPIELWEPIQPDPDT